MGCAAPSSAGCPATAGRPRSAALQVKALRSGCHFRSRPQVTTRGGLPPPQTRQATRHQRWKRRKPAMSDRLKVFLVDDHGMFRAGVRAELGAHVDVVGEAATVAQAISLIGATEPNVVLLDVHMPDGGGRAVLDGIRRAHPQMKFLALSVSDAAEDLIGVIRAGARV